MKLPLVVHLCLSVAIGVIILCVVKFCWIPKIGYVRVGVIMEKYQGMVEATQQYETDIKIAQANMDTVRSRYVAFRQNHPSEAQIRQADQEMNAYQQKFGDDLNKRRAALSKPVIDKINAYISDYGKSHNYKVILGATAEGNLLYAQESEDLTQTILDDLNAIYLKNKK